MLVVTVDPAAGRIARRYGARLVEDGARDGHTGAVAAAARLLMAERRAGMLTLPGDIPLVTADEIEPARRGAPAGAVLHDRPVA